MASEPTRIVFTLDPSDGHGHATEELRAEAVGEGRYRLLSSPFYAFDVSAGDTVFAEERDGQLSFVRVSARGGHSTYRLRLTASERPSASFDEAWAPLAELGCSLDQGPVLVVDVPASVDIYDVYELLEDALDDGVWDFEEAHCGHPLRDDDDE